MVINYHCESRGTLWSFDGDIKMSFYPVIQWFVSFQMQNIIQFLL